MKKVLFIDPIHKGYRNFLRLNDKFLELGYSTILVHTSSFYYDIDSDEEQIDNLTIRDIRYYKTKLIRKVIEKEKPSIILILNLSFIFDRAIVNIAKKNNIKIVYLAHGSLINPSSYQIASSKLDKEIKNNTSRIFTEKNFWILVNYLDSQKKGNKVISLFNLINGIINQPSQYLTFAKYEKELDVDLIMVYENKDKIHLTSNMNFPAEKIKVVGNPEITQFMQAPLLDKYTFLSNEGIKSTKYAVYLDDGLVADKEWNREEWYDHLESIVGVLGKKNIQLVLKLHPRTDFNEHISFFNKWFDNIIPVVDADFKNLLFHCNFAISHCSTTIVYALLFNKKVIIPKWSKNSRSLDNKYPDNVVTYCYNIRDFEKTITENLNETDIANIQNYLKENGIDKNRDSIKLIVNHVLSLFEG